MNKQKSVKRKGETASVVKRSCLGGDEAHTNEHNNAVGFLIILFIHPNTKYKKVHKRKI